MTVMAVLSLSQMLRVIALEKGSRPRCDFSGAFQARFGRSNKSLKVCKT